MATWHLFISRHWRPCRRYIRQALFQTTQGDSWRAASCRSKALTSACPPTRPGLEQVCQRGWPHRAASPQLVRSGWPTVNQRQWPAPVGGMGGGWVGGGRGWRATTRWALRRGIKHAALANSGFMMWGQSRWGRGWGCCRRASCQLRWSLCYI